MSIQLDTINLFVADIRDTLKFYSLLGFTFDDKDYSKDYVKLSFGNIALCFYSLSIVQDFFKKDSVRLGSQQQFELSFRVNKPEEVDILFNRLVKEGYHSFRIPENTDWNQRTIYLRFVPF